MRTIKLITHCCHCGGSIEFAQEDSGDEIPCPRCGKATELHPIPRAVIPPAPLTSEPVPRKTPAVLLAGRL